MPILTGTVQTGRLHAQLRRIRQLEATVAQITAQVDLPPAPGKAASAPGQTKKP